MIIGSMTVEVSLPKIGSVKEKRSKLKPLLSRIGGAFNVSVAEVGRGDIYRSGVLGVAIVADEQAAASATLNGVVNMIKSEPDMILVDYTTEML
ncbi:MAG TPA: DUF503 domain-containing protein [candidate division Zixibacteria bacterium]|nr:DUF503 domain-containing protein [candidate division Zixibacteria bacterium]